MADTPKPEPTPTPTPEPTPAPTPEKPTPTTPPAPAGDPPKEKPDPATAQPAESAEDAVARERARVTALMALDRPATHALVTAAIKDGKTVADVAEACMKAMDSATGRALRRADATVLDGIPPSDPTGEDANDFGNRITASVKKQLKNRRPVIHSRS
jgi:outer membrane biosynthesis protein TonB